MRYLGIDYGLKRIGLAMCDPGEMIVSPFRVLCMSPSERAEVVCQIGSILKEFSVEGVVVGLPLNMDDSEGPQAKQTRGFVTLLKQEFDVPIYLQDERLSSAAADEMLSQTGLSKKKRKQKRDMLAACEILRDFLDHSPHERNPLL